MKKFIALPLIAVLGLASPMMALPSMVNAQQAATMPNVEHIPLSVALAKKAIDATLFIRKNYENASFTDADATGMVNSMKVNGVYNKLLSELRSFGFSSPEKWSKAAVSTAIAVGFVNNEDGQGMMAQMQAMQNDPNLSDDMKAQMMATMKAVMPPKGNMKVAKELLKDSAYAAKVKKLFDN